MVRYATLITKAPAAYKTGSAYPEEEEEEEEASTLVSFVVVL
jgi:hypothetical protein